MKVEGEARTATALYDEIEGQVFKPKTEKWKELTTSIKRKILE